MRSGPRDAARGTAPAPRQSPPLDPAPARIAEPAASVGAAGGLGALPLTGIGDEAAVDIAGQIETALALGWDRLELRTVDGIGIADLPDGAFEAVAGQLADAGLAVAAVDSRIGGWSRPASEPFAADLREFETLARRCAVLGARFVRVMSWPDGGLDEGTWAREVLRRTVMLAVRAADAGLVLLHENCAGWAGADASRALRLLEATGGSGYGLLFDTGNGPAYGYDGLDLLRGLLPVAAHIHHVHVKDAVTDDGGVPRYRAAGEGELRVAEALRLLAAHGYAGALSVEPHLAVLPHENWRAEPQCCRAEFVRAAHALRDLVSRQDVPTGRDGTEVHA